MIRFHGKQLAATVYNGALGLFVGMSVSPLIFGVIGTVALYIVRKDQPVASACVLLVFALMVWFLLWRGVQSDACDAAKRYPIALMAVPISILAGALLVGASVTYNAYQKRSGTMTMVGISMLAGGAVKVIAATRGSRRGVLERHGAPQPGVGEMCAGCMYDLRATETGKPCSECGHLMRFGKYVQL